MVKVFLTTSICISLTAVLFVLLNICPSTHKKNPKIKQKKRISCVTGYTFVLQDIPWSFCGANALSQHPANISVLKTEQNETVSLCQVADTEPNPTRRIKTDVWGPFTSAALVNVNHVLAQYQPLFSTPPFSIPSQLAHYLPSTLFCSESILFSSSLIS